MAVIQVFFDDSGAIGDVRRRERGVIMETAADVNSAIGIARAWVQRFPLPALATPIQKPLLIAAIRDDPRVDPARRAELLAVVESADPSDTFEFGLRGSAIGVIRPEAVVAAFGEQGTVPPSIIVRYTDP